MDVTEQDMLMFFNAHPGSLPLFHRFYSALMARYPETRVRVQKTQISFYNRHLFACVSFAAVKRKAELPDHYFVLTLGLPKGLESCRVASKSEPYPGRWTTHLVISSPDELDEELFGWIDEAWQFAESK